jgi:hypothetical protein
MSRGGPRESIITVLPEPYQRVFTALKSKKQYEITLEKAKNILWNTPGIHFWYPVTIEGVLKTLDTLQLIEFDEENKKIFIKQSPEKSSSTRKPTAYKIAHKRVAHRKAGK